MSSSETKCWITATVPNSSGRHFAKEEKRLRYEYLRKRLPSKLFDMLDAILEQLFTGITLSLNDDMRNNKDIVIQIEKADHIIWDCEKLDGAMEELHKCLVTYIIEHFVGGHERLVL